MQLTEQQKGCPFCHGRKKLMEKYDDQNYQYMWIDPDDKLQQMVMVNGCRAVDTLSRPGQQPLQLNYCPICGRRLTDED